jgi:hypothetical protein
MENHYIAHQHALVKDHIVFCVLSFDEHDTEIINKTLNNFRYDEVINLCEVNKEAYIGWSWDGTSFHENLYSGWILGEDLKWYPPIEKPADSYVWNNEEESWVELSNGSN